MFLQRIIKTWPFLFFLLVSNLGTSQKDSVQVAKSPYSKEKIDFFEFGVFQRGFTADSLKIILDHLEKKRKDVWTRGDSLQFAQTTLRTGNTDLADYYFSYLEPSVSVETEYWWNYMMVFILTENYRGGLEKLNEDNPGVFEFSEVYFLKKILIANIAESNDNKWHKNNSVLKWEIDSTLSKKDEDFRETVVEPIENLDKVLRRLIHYIHEEDVVISRTCFEMSLVIEKHLSLSQAYIAMSLARHYNKWDKEILNNIKRIKSKLLEKKYKIPNFRKYFPRTEYWRFDYEMLKEKAKLSKEEADLQAPVLRIEREKEELPIDPDLLTLIGIAFVFVLVFLFLRPKKR